jgi:hypothetical protein
MILSTMILSKYFGFGSAAPGFFVAKIIIARRAVKILECAGNQPVTPKCTKADGRRRFL